MRGSAGSQCRAVSQGRGLAAKGFLEAGAQADGGDTVYGTGDNSSKSLHKVSEQGSAPGVVQSFTIYSGLCNLGKV